MDSLHDVLWNSTVDQLKFRLTLLARKPKSARKADCIEAVKEAYAARELVGLWESLDDLEKRAVAETCHAPDQCFDESRFRAKYGECPEFFDVPEEKRYSWWENDRDPEYATRLHLLVFWRGRNEAAFIPEDLAAQLRAFVPEPAAAKIASSEEAPAHEGMVVRETEHDTVADLPALLQLAEQGTLKFSDKTGMPSAATNRQLVPLLSGGDFHAEEVAFAPTKWSHEQQIGFIKPVAWVQLLHNGGLIGMSGSRSRLTAAGRKAMGKPPHEVIRELWDKWVAKSKFDEFGRVDDIKGQASKRNMTSRPERRAAIISALEECPPGRWIDVDQFSDYMQAAGHRFLVCYDPSKLYLCEQRYGNFGYRGYGGWHTLQFRYLLAFLLEYAATLGLIDIAHVHPEHARHDFRDQWGADEMKWLSRYDGLRAFRITNLGAWCLGLSDEFKASRPASSLRLRVLPGLVIERIEGEPAAAERLLLETWAEPETATTWRLDPARAVAAVERGRDPDELAMFLEACDDQPLPQAVEGFLKMSRSDGTAVRREGDAILFRCRDAATADLLCSRKELKRQCLKLDSDRVVVTAEGEAAFRRVVRALGLGVVVGEE